MKKILIVFLFALVSFSYAQHGMQMQFSDGAIIPNGARLYACKNDASRLIYSDVIYIKNLSNNILRLKVKKTVLFKTAYISNSYSALSQDVPNDDFITPNVYELSPGVTLDDDNAFQGELHKTSNVPGAVGALIRYTFLSLDVQGTVIDSVYIDQSYSSASLLSLGEDESPNIYSEILITAEVDKVHNYPIYLVNHNPDNIPVRVSKQVDAQVNSTYDFYFKFGGSTYLPSDNFDNGEGVVIAAGDTLKGDNDNVFIAYFDPHTQLSDEMAKVTYTFFNKALGSNVDGIKVSLLYNVSGIGFAEHDTYHISKPYPNPAVNYFYLDIEAQQATDINVKIYNVAGQMVQQMPVDKTSGRIYVSTGHLEAGVYFVNIELQGKSIGVEKLIVN